MEDQIDWVNFWNDPEKPLEIAGDAISRNSGDVSGNQRGVNFDRTSETSKGSSRGIYQNSAHRQGSGNEVRAYQRSFRQHEHSEGDSVPCRCQRNRNEDEEEAEEEERQEDVEEWAEGHDQNREDFRLDFDLRLDSPLQAEYFEGYSVPQSREEEEVVRVRDEGQAWDREDSPGFDIDLRLGSPLLPKYSEGESVLQNEDKDEGENRQPPVDAEFDIDLGLWWSDSENDSGFESSG